MNPRLTKAVIPVAGLGTRFLPATKVVPKELLPIVDKPALLYVIEEALASGLTDIILVTSPAKPLLSKETVLKLLDGAAESPPYPPLKKGGVCSVPPFVKGGEGGFETIGTIETVVQDKPLGLGHAVLCAKEAVGDEWFVVLLPDMLIDADPTCTEQLIKVWRDLGKSVIATEHSPRELLSNYGIIATEKIPPSPPFKKGGVCSVPPFVKGGVCSVPPFVKGGVCSVPPFVKGGEGGFSELPHHLHKVAYLVEKPPASDAPSDLTIIGRYLLPSSIFAYLERTKPGHGGEIQITDALSELAKSEGMYAYEYKGVLHDTGDKLGLLKANIYYGLKRQKYNKGLRNYLSSLATMEGIWD